MKILIITSSGNKNGFSNILAAEFARGAKESGHEVENYDVMTHDIRPCNGCNVCGMNGLCVQKDDFEDGLKDGIRSADMLVFTMPVYYYNWPAQMKAVVDRFYSFTGELTRMHKKAALLTVAWDNTDKAFEIVVAYYHRLCEYMQFQDCGMVIGKGCGTVDMTKRSKYPQEAFELGKRV